MNKLKYFKAECEWKWKYDNQEDKLCAKININDYDVREKYKIK